MRKEADLNTVWLGDAHAVTSEKGNSRTCPKTAAPFVWAWPTNSISSSDRSRRSPGKVLHPDGLTARAAEIAARQRSPETRRTYAAVYRIFCAFLGPEPMAEDLTPERVRSYRDRLERAGRTPATVFAKHLSALRQLAQALDADPAIRTVRSQSVARGEPRALSQDEFARLLRMPDRRTRQGKRDLALLQLLGSAGLRRAEAAGLLITDVDERRRSGDPRLRQAIARSTSWWVTVRYGKRGRTRAIPLDEDTLSAITAWVKIRPVAATEHLLLSLPRTGQPPRALSTRDIAGIIARHAANAGLPEDRRSPHVYADLLVMPTSTSTCSQIRSSLRWGRHNASVRDGPSCVLSRSRDVLLAGNDVTVSASGWATSKRRRPMSDLRADMTEEHHAIGCAKLFATKGRAGYRAVDALRPHLVASEYADKFGALSASEQELLIKVGITRRSA